MKSFVTGGSGFIGQQLIRKLVARGDEVIALARSESSAAIVSALGATAVLGDINEPESMREAMQGCDRVFHLAAWYKLGAAAGLTAEMANVGGTRTVLRLAHELGVPKIIYTSTIAVFGDTNGRLVDETYYRGRPFLSEYDRTKWLAHYKVALPLIAKGAPIIIVMPGGVYGPNDTSVIADTMRFFYRGMPAIPGPSTTLTYAHVEDVAEGHLLAAEKGKVGESYILAGPAIPLGEMVDLWSRLLGKSTPMLRLPASVVRPLAPWIGWLSAFIQLPPLFSEEAIRAVGATYMARSDKARTELGWQTRPLQGGMLETFRWIEADEQATPANTERRFGWLFLAAALIFFLFWWRRRK